MPGQTKSPAEKRAQSFRKHTDRWPMVSVRAVRFDLVNKNPSHVICRLANSRLVVGFAMKRSINSLAGVFENSTDSIRLSSKSERTLILSFQSFDTLMIGAQ